MPQQIIRARDLTVLFGSTRRDAQELLPHLTRRLITATADLSNMRRLEFPVGDQVTSGGWDGVVDFIATHPFIPSGVSAWETGVATNPAEKATEDFRKRTRQPLDIVPEESTFVFVTPHLWGKKREWIATRKAESHWKDVRVLDGNDLELWLELTPAVGSWIVGRLGRPVTGVAGIKDYWAQALQARFGDAITHDLVIGGRDRTASELLTWFGNPDRPLCVQGESTEEVSAFIAAAVLRLSGQHQEVIESRAVFVSDPAAFEHLEASGQPMVAILQRTELFDELVAKALTRVHAILALGRNERALPGAITISLPDLQRSALEDELIKAGHSRPRASVLARESRGSFRALQWLLRLPAASDEGHVAAILAAIVLLGGWEQASSSDHEIAAELADVPYERLKQVLEDRSGVGKELERCGDWWQWKARSAWWQALSVRFTEELLFRFLRVAVKALREPDPALELPVEQRWMAAITGRRHPYSAKLRSGIVESMCLLATKGDSVSGHNGASIASRIVREVLAGPELAVRWGTLARWLPDLAEASPPVFLESLNKLLAAPSEAVKLFTDKGPFTSSPHTNLLWALERLAWSPQHLTRVILALAALAKIDPGGTYSNRPASSIRTILLPWCPCTMATVEGRLAALDALNGRDNKLAWSVSISLLPRRPDHNMPATKPEWRTEWSVPEQPSTTYQEHDQFIVALAERVVRWAGNDSNRWCDLVESVGTTVNCVPIAGQHVLDALASLDVSGWAEAERRTLWEKLQSTVGRHEGYPDADWSMPTDAVAQLRQTLLRIEPQDPMSRYRTMFKMYPERVFADRALSYQEQEEKARADRLDAVKAVIAMHGLDRAIAWARELESPETLGHALADRALAAEDKDRVIRQTLVDASIEPSDPLVRCGIGFVSTCYRLQGQGWRDDTFQRLDAQLAGLAFARFALGLPATLETWVWIDQIRPACAPDYWAKVHIYPESVEAAAFAARRLLDANRPFTAIAMLGMLACVRSEEGNESEPPAAIVSAAAELLDCSIDHPPEAEHARAGLGHYVGRLIAFLERAQTPPHLLAAWEFRWMAAMRHEEGYCKTLRRLLADDPSLFVDLLKLVYRRDDGAPDEQEPTSQTGGEQRRARSRQAHDLLESWHLLPGLAADARVVDPSVPQLGTSPARPAASGLVDGSRLAAWIDKARSLSAQCGRLNSCDAEIGRVFALAPADADGLWPCLPVRDQIERLESDDLERGLDFGVYRRRGVHSTTNDGRQERKIAEAFERHAEACQAAHPRTAAVLRNLVNSYLAEGRLEDERGKRSEWEH